MDYRERFAKENENLIERFALVSERINQICEKSVVNDNIKGIKALDKLNEYFEKTAKFLKLLKTTFDDISSGQYFENSLEDLKEKNTLLYEDILPENYNKSFANPKYAVKHFGSEYGKLLYLLYSNKI